MFFCLIPKFIQAKALQFFQPVENASNGSNEEEEHAGPSSLDSSVDEINSEEQAGPSSVVSSVEGINSEKTPSAVAVEDSISVDQIGASSDQTSLEPIMDC